MSSTRFLIETILPAWNLGADFADALQNHGILAGSAAVQCALETTDWWAGDLDIFVENEDAAEAVAAALGGYELVWQGDAEGPAMEEINDNFAASVNEMRIYQQWADYEGRGEEPFAGTAFAGLPSRTRLVVKIYIGSVDLMLRTADLLHAMTHLRGNTWHVATGTNEQWTRDRFWSSLRRRSKWEGRGFRIA
jgi:hypothetical protein